MIASGGFAMPSFVVLSSMVFKPGFRAAQAPPYDDGVDFYGEVLVEIMAALGAALFAANAYALIRRRRDRAEAARESAVRSRPGSPVRKQVRPGTTGNLDEAPVGRTVAFMLLGLFVAISSIAALTA